MFIVPVMMSVLFMLFVLFVIIIVMVPALSVPVIVAVIVPVVALFLIPRNRSLQPPDPAGRALCAPVAEPPGIQEKVQIHIREISLNDFSPRIELPHDSPDALQLRRGHL